MTESAAVEIWRAGQRVGFSLGLSAILIASSACKKSERSGSSGQPVQITFGEISTAASHTPLYVAVEAGFFKRAGLDVSIQKLTGGTPSAMAAMATGSVNMLMAGSTECIEYSAKKVISGKVIAELQDSTLDVVTPKGITDVQQLKGKSIGISGLNGGDQIYLEAVFQHYGLSSKDVTFITSGTAINRLTALSSGSVQAIAAANSSRETSEKIGSILIKSSDSPVQIPTSVIFANTELITTEKLSLQKFLKVLSEATVWVKANPEAAAPYCIKGSGGTREACLSAFKILSNPAIAGKYTWSSKYEIDTAGMQTALAAEKSRSSESEALGLSDIVDTSIAGANP